MFGFVAIADAFERQAILLGFRMIVAFEGDGFAMVPARVNGNGTLRTVDVGFTAGGSQEGGVQVGHLAAAVAEGDADLFVDPGGADPGQRLQLSWFAQHQQGEEDRVDADIEQGAAAQGVVIQAAFGVDRRFKTEVGLYRDHLPDGSFFDQLEGLAKGRQKARPQRFHEQGLFPAGRFDHSPHFVAVHGKGFFAEHRQFMLQTEQGVFAMVGMLGGDVNGVQLGRAHQFFVGSVVKACLELFRESLGALFRAGGYGVQTGARDQAEVFGKLAGDLSEAEDAPVKRLVHFPGFCSRCRTAALIVRTPVLIVGSGSGA